ncbi:MAG TPA: hypothetical protein VGN34_23910, partial [Ktedonobacteraceae bacterium]
MSVVSTFSSLLKGLEKPWSKWTTLESHTYVVASIYKMAMEEPRWKAVSPGSVERILRFRADFPGFTLKIVEHSRY